MSCDNLQIPKPTTNPCPTTLFGIPYQTAGRTVAGTTFPIAGIVLHCYDGTVAELCNEMKCRTRSSVISGSWENSFHYGIGASAGSGGFIQPVEDGNIAWTFGTYKNNTYATVPPPNIAINWPVLQSEYGINTTPDVYTLNIALAIGHIVDATQSGCYTCPTASGLQQTQHDMLVQLLAFLVQEYNIPIDADHITFHDLIHCGEGTECPCTDLDTLLAEVAAFCPPCEEEATVAPDAQIDDVIEFIYGITEPCCPSSPGCLVKIPWNGCFIGDLATDGDLTSYILGLSQDPVTMQWCMTRGCLAILPPLIGCGTVDDPLQIDRCLIGAWLPDEPVANAVNLVAIDAQGCAIEVPACELVVECETELTVVDTNCIDLTASGVNGHTLQADIIISPDVGNQVECRANGLYGVFDCDEFKELFQTVGVVDWVSGVDDQGDCVQEDISAIFDRLFSVADTDCIDLDWTNNVLSAQPIIDPAGNNILTCGQNGLLVPDFVVADGDCVDLTFTGNELSAEIIISPNPGNLVECLANGLYAGFEVADTDCMDLDFTNGILTLSPIISPSVGSVTNVFDCLATGMYTPRGANALVNGPLTGNGSDINPLDINFSLLDAQDLCDLGSVIVDGALEYLIGLDQAECLRRQLPGDVLAGALSVADTDCIDMSFVAGVISATLDIDPQGSNVFTCTPNGAYVPIGAGLTVQDTDCIDLDLVAGQLQAFPILAGTQGGVPNILNCVAGEGLYVPEGGGLTVQNGDCITMSLVSAVLRADIVVDPTGDNQITCLPAGMYVPPLAGLLVDDTDCISVDVTGQTLTASPILAPSQGGIDNALECIAGQGLYVPVTDVTSLVVADTDCIDLTLVGNVLSADPILAPAQLGVANGLQCLAGGLYVPQCPPLVITATQVLVDVYPRISYNQATCTLNLPQEIVARITNNLANGINVPLVQNVWTPISAGFTIINTDTTGGAAIGAGTLIIPITGVYDIDTYISVASGVINPGESIALGISINGVVTRIVTTSLTQLATAPLGLLNFLSQSTRTAGDVIGIEVFTDNNGSSVTGASISIKRLEI